MKTYILYDGRAAYDIESASVLECFEAKSDEHAKKYVKKYWKGYDCVLATIDNVLV